MDSKQTIGGGWLDDLERIERQTRKAQQLFDAGTGTAEAADGLIEVTVTARGELTKLFLDPRVYRDLGAGELAEEIVAAVNNAHRDAEQRAVRAFAEQLPVDWPDRDDPAFGPFLAELDRLQGRNRR
ncbi:YbaB/EbfC family nucleoid-associated protein [Kribbella sindirgiensis]|uniref:YbaB/EbfC family DNA-binding protein n=1 Tax=Kribbella sindirgiensis TaxID=1124744 RepID=A0A4R0I3Z5_9ACTN|nr:YbaB/EbfC family nucleoid-associated protein [Kribbella sindirgiensis]TCC22331.1 YbaB/EbfC family DNA-binding protein [Kribbella sindirgiensis]